MPQNYKLILKRYEDHNLRRIIGFDVILSNRQIRYFEHHIPISDCSGKSVTEVCQIVFSTLKPSIREYIRDHNSFDDIPIGAEFIPSDDIDDLSSSGSNPP
jgi:hypothetical protein